MRTNTAKDVIREIELLAARKGMTVSAFLRAVDTDAGLFHKWKRGEVVPTEKKISKIRELARSLKRA